MIEVERKIEVDSSFLDHVAKQGRFISKKSIADTYFDTNDYRYTIQNIWLRKRGQSTFELKKAVKRSDRTIDRYEEITNLQTILETLNICGKGDFESLLHQASIFPFVSFITHRETYHLQPFTIDIDIADFGDFTYRIAEIECLVEKEEEIMGVELQINQFLQQFVMDLTKKPMAKLTMYLLKQRPAHYEALERAGIV